jgi:hypothetical protein
MEKNKRIFYAFIIASFALGIFPVIEYILAQQGLSTCGEEGIGCRVVGMVTPYGTTPFFILGSIFGISLGLAALFRAKIIVPALLCAGIVVEGSLLAFQINLGFFCRFCLIYALGVLVLTIIYLVTTPRAFVLFALPFAASFMAIPLLYFSFTGADIEKSYILEQQFEETETAHFYLFYSHTCGHCANTLNALDKNRDKLKGTFRLAVTDGNIARAEAAKQYVGSSIFEQGLKGMAGDPEKATQETISQCETAKRYMAKNGISETPTMIVVDGEKWTTIVKGTTNILDYLEMRFDVKFEEK